VQQALSLNLKKLVVRKPDKNNNVMSQGAVIANAKLNGGSSEAALTQTV